jgi:hypothetical protein
MIPVRRPLLQLLVSGLGGFSKRVEAKMGCVFGSKTQPYSQWRGMR